jgi:fimbrial isopeptide formation D2 family protein/LPXTG-motif cell wall-anchored protein
MKTIMKKMRKIFALLMAMVMVLGMGTMVFAAGTGSITITPPADVDDSVAITYNVYKVFDADGNGTAISYKLVSGKTTAPAGFTVDTAGNVTYSGTSTTGELTQDDIDAIAAYVTSDSPVATVTSTGGAAAVASNLPNGYYYITTTTGTVVTIDSTNPNATVEDKNIVPGVDKKITGASSYDTDGKKALAQVGTEVTFTATITVGKGQIGYEFNDTMSSGLTYVADSLTVTGIPAAGYTATASGQTIKVEFDDTEIAKLAQGAEIVLTYKATITENALNDDPENNTATISYGNNSQYTSEPSTTQVYNAQFSVNKKDGNGDPLADAGFVIANADGKYYKLDNGIVTWVDSIDAADEHVSDAQGAVAPFTGLANGTYTLIEKTVPAGYNKAADSTFTVAEHDYTADNLQQEADVTNNSGTELPSTGGIGTTIFYIIGAILVIGAGVVLVTRRRMNVQ